MCAMDEEAIAALRDLYSDLEIDGRVLYLGTGQIEHRFEVPPDALVRFDGDPAALPYADARVRRRDLPRRRSCPRRSPRPRAS